jgi:GAF domain-containing protein
MVDLAPLHAALTRIVIVGRPLQEVLDEIVVVARQAMPGSEATSITLIRREHSFTAAFAGQVAMDADELQYERGYGPCMDAARAGQVFVVHDMGAEDRWPDYARHVAALGVRSSLSVPLPFQDAVIGALNNYSTKVGAFGDDDLALGKEVAAWVAVAVGNAHHAARSVEDLADMQAAMVARGVIEQAKGILMERHKITEDDAFKLLARASQDTNTKLRVVATDLVRTGALPVASPVRRTASPSGQLTNP